MDTSDINREFDAVPSGGQPLPGPNTAGAIDLPANLVAIVNAYGANTGSNLVVDGSWSAGK